MCIFNERKKQREKKHKSRLSPASMDDARKSSFERLIASRPGLKRTLLDETKQGADAFNWNNSFDVGLMCYSRLQQNFFQRNLAGRE